MRLRYKLQPKEQQIVQRLVDISNLYDARIYRLLLPIVQPLDVARAKLNRRKIPGQHQTRRREAFASLRTSGCLPVSSKPAG